MATTAAPTFTGVSHIDLTVSDLDRSETFYTELLGAVRLLEGRNDDEGCSARYVLHGDTMTVIGLVLHDRKPEADFDPRRVGLDHLSFNVGSRAELDLWQAKLEAAGIAHGGIHDEEMWDVLPFRDPDGIQLEFFFMKAAAAALIGG